MFSKLLKKTNSPVDSSFAMRTFNNNGQQYLLRIKRDADIASLSKKYPYQMGIATKLINENNGFPSKDENQKLIIMEDIIEQAFTKNENAIFIAALTGGGMKEFVFYVHDYTIAAKTYEKLNKEIKHHEIQCIIKEDPQWEVYKVLNE